MSCIGKIKRDKYLYVLLDPRIKGPFYFHDLGITFQYKPFYVGIGNYGRWNQHKRDAINELPSVGNKGKKGRIRKILNENMDYTVWKIGPISKNNTILQEKIFIELMGRIDLGTGCLFNLTDGGEYFDGFVITDEYRKKISLACSGKKNGFYGKHHSKETKKILSTFRIGSITTQDTKNKISNSLKGKTHTDETKKKISNSHLGKKKRPMKEETKNKISNTLKGRSPHNKGKILHINKRLKRGNYWKIIDPDGNELVIKNLNLFCQTHGLTQSGMYYVSKGICSHHKGYKCYKLENI